MEAQPGQGEQKHVSFGQEEYSAGVVRLFRGCEGGHSIMGMPCHYIRATEVLLKRSIDLIAKDS